MHETIIAAGTRVEGSISGQMVRIFGQVTGAIDGDEVIVEGSGHVGGSVSAQGVRVLGRVDGSIQAQRVIIEASGMSLGGIAAPSVNLAEGCTIQGRLDSNLPAPTAAAPVHYAAAPTPQPAQAVTAYVSEPHPSTPPTAVATQPPAPTPSPALPATPRPAPTTAPTAFSLDGVRLTVKD